jgi:hypothetical protein
MLMAVVVALGACGGGGGDSADAYVKPLAAAMRQGEDSLPVDDSQATCIATALVNVFGAGKLKQAGVSPQEFVEASDYTSLDAKLPAGAEQSFSTALAACDVSDELEGVMIAPLSGQLGGELPPDGQACLSEQMDDKAVADAWSAAIIDGADNPFNAVLGDAVSGCPSVATTFIVSQLGLDVSPEVEACIGTVLQSNPDLVSSMFSPDAARTASEELGTQLGTACPGIVGA